MNKRLKLNERDQAILKKIDDSRHAIFSKYPLPFTLLGALGLAATFYGFERVLDDIQFFADNPWLLLGFGIGILIFTGTLYKKLQ